MSQAAVSVYAELALKKDRLLADAKALPNELKQAFGAKGIELPVALQLAADTQARLTAALAKITPPSVNVRINWVSGPFPGAPGGAGGGGMPAGSSSLNVPMLMAQQAQQIIAGLSPTSSPNWSYLLRNQGGGGGPGPGPGSVGGSNLYNPFSPRGLARLMGSGAAAYGALAAVHVATGLVEGADTAAHPERVLDSMSKPGSLHFAGEDPLMRGSAQRQVSLQGDKEKLSALEGIPLVGTLARFVDALTGATRAIEDNERIARQTVQMHEYIQGQQEESNTRNIGLTHSPLAILEDRHRLEAQKDETAIKIAKAEAAAAYSNIGGDKSGLPEFKRKEQNLREALGVAVTNEPIRAEEIRQAKAAEQLRNERSTGGLLASSTETLSISRATAGDAAGSLASRQAAARLRLQTESDVRINDPSINKDEKKRRERDADADLTALQAKQGLETLRFQKEQERAAGDSAARIADIYATEDERMLRATGNTYDAMIAQSKRQTAERVADLRRQADAEVGNAQKKKELNDQANAVEIAGRRELDARRITRARDADLESSRAASDLGVARLAAGGAHGAAERKAQDDRYFEEADTIIRSGDNVQQRMATLDARHKAQRLGMERHDELTSEQRQLRAAAMNAEATGDNVTGQVLALRANARHEFEDANGDVGEQHDVTRLNLARLRAIRRSATANVPRSSDGEQFARSLGQALGNSGMNADARKLMDRTEAELKRGGVGKDDLPAAGKKLEDAAEKLEKASDNLNNKKIAVLDAH